MPIVRRCLVVLSLAATVVAGAACLPVEPAAPGATTRVSGDSSWAFTVSSDGVVHVQLSNCFVRYSIVHDGRHRRGTQPCPTAAMILTTPWGAAVGPSSVAEDRAAYAIDWSTSPADPLDPRTHPAMAGSWQVTASWLERPVLWAPPPAEVVRMIALAGAAKGIETEVATGGPPPELVVEDFHVAGRVLLGGAPTELVLTVGNRGSGDAYRVFVTTRSSVAEVHGLQLSFGTIVAGGRETRRVVATVPATLRDRDATVVLEFAEANHHVPRNVGKRFPVRALASSPRLTLTCALRPGAAVVAGDIVHVLCTVGNDGVDAATEVVVETVGGVAPTRVELARIAHKLDVEVDVPIAIPPGARIDQRIPLTITAHEPHGGSRAQAVVEVVVRVPKVCPEGRMTREAYRIKRAELEAARDAGELTAAEFDRYDVELVGCLQ